MIRNVKTADHYRWGEVCDGWHLLQRPDLSVIQERIPPGAGEITHFHARARQLFYVLAGQLQIQLRDHSFQLTTGDSLEVPPGDLHRVRNVGDAEVAFLVVSAPTTQGDRIDVEPVP